MRRASEGSAPLTAYVVAYLIFLYLPVALIPLFSFNDSIQAAFPLQGFTLDWYGKLIGNSALSSAFANSMVVAIAAAAGATLSASRWPTWTSTDARGPL